MALKDYKIPTRTIKIDGKNSFEVRGLSLPDITHIIDAHGPIVDEFFKRYTRDLESGNPDEEMMVMGKTLIEAAPELLASIIAISADEPDMTPVILKLPFTVQIEAIEAIGKLTFEAAGGVKKAFEMVAKVVLNLTDFAVDLRVSKSSSMVSEGKSAS